MGGMVFPVWWSGHINSALLRLVGAGAYNPAAAGLCEAQWRSPEAIAELQAQRLRELLEHAWENCPFYRARMEEAGLAPGRIERTEDLARLPALTKRDIQQHRDEMVARCFDRSELWANHTGGSTGDPLHFYWDKGDHTEHRNARALRGNQMAGWRDGKRTVSLWGAGIDVKPSRTLKGRLSAWARNSRLLDCTVLDEAVIGRQLEAMRAFRPQIVVSYATIAYMFASAMLERGVTDIRPEAVITSAETLAPAHRQVIERAFGCKVFDRYGCRESGLMAAECERHEGLHIAADELVLEVVDEAGRPALKGTLGEILVTDLFNYGMPFIRYQIGDMGVLAEEPCSCGRGLPLLKEVAGRTADIIRLPSGRRIAGLAIMCGFAERCEGVANLQLVRTGPVDFTLRIVRKSTYADDELQYLKHKMAELFGDEVHVDYEFVTDVKRYPSGKYQFLVSDLPSDGVS